MVINVSRISFHWAVFIINLQRETMQTTVWEHFRPRLVASGCMDCPVVVSQDLVPVQTSSAQQGAGHPSAAYISMQLNSKEFPNTSPFADFQSWRI